MGGVIYSDSADKAARVVMNCNQDKIPILFIHDVNGFMVGKDSEWGGIAKDGAKLFNAVSNSTVPKIPKSTNILDFLERGIAEVQVPVLM